MKFYRSFDILRSKADKFQSPLVLQWEIPKPRDALERMYIVCESVTEYMYYLNRGRYNTCHEVFVSPLYETDSEIYGHLALDIDIHVKDLPSTWYDDLCQDILSVLQEQYPTSGISDIGKTVWISSASSEKISRHLVIHGITFTMWHTQMKLLIEGLKSRSNCKSISHVIDGIDLGITRRLGSLRLPLNRKRDKDNILTFDDPTHTFTDGLVLIYDENKYTMKDTHLLLVGDLNDDLKLAGSYSCQKESVQSYIANDNDDVVSKAIEIFCKEEDRRGFGLQPASSSPIEGGVCISLRRVRPGKCPISDKIHDSDGAYLIVKNIKFNGNCFDVMFGCHRKCMTSVNGGTKLIMLNMPSIGHGIPDEGPL